MLPHRHQTPQMHRLKYYLDRCWTPTGTTTFRWKPKPTRGRRHAYPDPKRRNTNKEPIATCEGLQPKPKLYCHVACRKVTHLISLAYRMPKGNSPEIAHLKDTGGQICLPNSKCRCVNLTHDSPKNICFFLANCNWAHVPTCNCNASASGA